MCMYVYRAIENMMLLLLSSLSSSSCVLYYISTKQQHKSMWIKNHRKKNESFMANKMRTRSYELFFFVLLLKIHRMENTYCTPYESIQTESECVRVFCTNCRPRQDGDNVRHMHLIDLHLVKRSVSLRSIHEHRHQWTSANATATQHKQKKKREIVVCMVTTNEWTGMREWKSERVNECSWAIQSDMAFAVIRFDTVTVQWIFAEPPHTRIYQWQANQQQQNTMEPNDTNKTCHGENVVCKMKQMNNQNHDIRSFGRESDRERERGIQQLRWKRALVSRIAKLQKRQVGSFRHLPFIFAKQNNTQNSHALRISSFVILDQSGMFSTLLLDHTLYRLELSLPLNGRRNQLIMSRMLCNECCQWDYFQTHS